MTGNTDVVSRLDKRTALARHFLFSHLPPEGLERLLALAVERRFSNDQVIFQKGETGSSMMLVLEGRVRISTCTPDGKEILFNVIGPGDVFGEIALLDGKERSANATADGECTLLIIRRRDFIPLLEQTIGQHPHVAIQLLDVLCRKLRDTSEIVEAVGLLSIPVRLARALIRMAESVGVKVPEGLRVDLTLSQREMGNLIGATRESVNKQLRAWEVDGLLALSQKRIVILQEKALKDIAASAF
jgi:CRP/FNR family cyclic AMP-dependent transcriptional regulator